MKTHFKLAIAAMLGVVGMALAACVLLTGLVGGDSQKEKQSFALQIRGAARALVELHNDQLADRLTSVLEKEAQTSDPSAALAASDFLAVGLISADKETTSGWSPEWVKSQNPKMNAEWMKGLLPSLPIERAVGDDIVWARVAFSEGPVYFVMLISLQVKSETGEQNKISFGVLPTSIFANVNLISKGDNASLFVVDGQGFTYSYPDQQYVGAKITAHPIVAALMKSQLSETTGHFHDGANGPIVGGYDRINKSNLYVVAAASLATKGAIFLKFIFQVGLISVGIMLLMAFTVFYLSSRDLQKMKILEQNLHLMQNSSQTEMQRSSQTESPIVIDTGDEKLKVFSKSVAHFLRAPISAIVGFAQMAESRNKDTVLKDLLEKILAETRKVRDFSEALFKIAGKSEPQVEVLDLNPIVSQVVSGFRSEMSKARIQFEENLKADLSIRANYDELTAAIKAIFTYVVNLVAKGRGDKRILLNVDKTGGLAQISLEGQGVELKADLRKKIFSPFETALPNSRILGLDLALAKSCVDEQGGEVMVESLGSEGLKIILRLPTVLKTTSVADEHMLLKPVSKEASLRLPPLPAPSEETVSQKLTLSGPKAVPQTESEEDKSSAIQIRRPKVRFDI